LAVLALSVAVPAMAPGIAHAGKADRAAKKSTIFPRPGGRLFYASDGNPAPTGPEVLRLDSSGAGG
jgi:hypothetical protein